MGLNWTEVVVIMLVVVLLFGGKVSGFLTDLAAGLKTFRRVVNEPDKADQTLCKVQRNTPPEESSHDV